jgi:hypothetical protein
MEERDDEMNPRRIDAERPENREGVTESEIT